MTKLELVGTLRMMADHHAQRAQDASSMGAINMHENYSKAATQAADYIDSHTYQTPEWLSQALNEGDGTYKP